MKKLILILLVFTTVAALAQEKEPKESKFNFGFGVGYSASSLKSKGDWHLDKLLYRPTFKAIVEYTLSSNCKLKSGLSYKKKGESYNYYYSNWFATSSTQKTFNSMVHYIELPVMISFHTSGTVQFYVNAGFFGAANVYTNSSITSRRELYRVEDDRYLKTVDFGGVLGMGVTIPVGSKYSIDIGLSDFKGLIHCKTANDTYTTNSFELLVAFKIK